VFPCFSVKGTLFTRPFLTNFIVSSLEQDVLCGKNKVCIDHPGSKVFRCVIEQYAQRYLEADSKFEKSKKHENVFIYSIDSV